MTPNDQRPTDPITSVGASADSVRESDKIMLVLAYFGIFSLIPLLTVKDSPSVTWHAKQGLVIAVAFFACSLLAAIPFGVFLTCLGYLGLLAVDLMAMTKALKGQRWRVPVLADLSEKF